MKTDEDPEIVDLADMGDKSVKIIGATENNLKDITVEFPLHKFVVVTGVSGSGKSTMVNDILYHALMQKKNAYHPQKPGKFKEMQGHEALKSVFAIDQSFSIPLSGQFTLVPQNIHRDSGLAERKTFESGVRSH